ncbi:MFS-type transporter SLC18B1-like [Haliotis rufescens]|uniref:MFS-type transporter SLC18B1-like n=1 Tax=Haliotis rufescens TaxID=6454 RepID=UPI00201E9AB0|nr:MFS-type transporter SLC18B1-like [Haliotis rufescens]
MCIFCYRDMGMNDDSQTQGLVSGLIMSALSLGHFIGPVIGGVLTDYFGFAWATTSGSFFCFMTLLVITVYLCILHRNKPSCILGSEDYQQLDKMENSKRATGITADTESKRLIKQGTN